MGNLLYFIAVLLIIGWIFSFLVYGAGSIIHILLVLALITIVFQVMRREGRIG